VAVWGADTDVGKSLVSAGLAAAAAASGWRVLYVKPVQTGYPADDDARTVARAARLPLRAGGAHAAALASPTDPRFSDAPSTSWARTLTAWSLPASPHAAVEAEGRGVPDAALAPLVAAELAAWAAAGRGSTTPSLALVETAGGPLSPTPAGGLQAAALAALRLPALMVASPRLGGVSATLAALESLRHRGHAPVAAVAVVGTGAGLPAGHAAALRAHAGAPVFELPPCPPPPPGWEGDGVDPGLQAWLAAAAPELAALLAATAGAADAATAALRSLPARAAAVTWWPFTQHDGLVAERDVCAVDGRSGDHLLVLPPPPPQAASDPTSIPCLTPLFDGCAAWWTQGATGPAGAAVRAGVAAALGRYGHVIHPETAIEPAVAAAEALIAGPGRGWAGKVFWSDDG
jgi:dethiobiotin synthetase/adenosylmethionine--8-amino-7-oxononanoate aminotransferase